ncbi:MAG: Beta-Ig-H3/fasciclin [Candidatus Saccharibacteria bacterium GW2011_GWC2_48_9]|nr:MAG: Beta-Ig-H3/fasciclin [Candidatus Saccharibacteria bacterium GW2011_GWC2_48_9]HCH34712.1 fasciclin [Candidatus Saccharibacteria bacterium]
MDSGNKVTAIVIAAIIGLVVGAGGGYALGGMQMDEDNNTSNSAMTSEKSEGVDGVTVGGAKMVREKDIVDNAMNADNVTTLVSLVDKADLVETLKGEGPFTVFGPNNDAFAKLDAATVESLQKPENKAALAEILTYHVVPGTYTSADLKAMVAKGQALTSVQGGKLMPMMDGGKLMIEDGKGDMVMIETADVISSNGVTHVIDSVLMQ